MGEVRKTLISEPSEAIVDRAIKAAGGERHEAIRALIRGQDAIRSQVLRHVSLGHLRGHLQ